MANHLISGSLIRVVIGSQTFDLPQEKAQQLLMMVRQWQSVSIPEQTYSGARTEYNGKSVLLG